MPIRDNDPRPAYQQLADELRQAIATGQYQPGDRLPSTRELSEAHGIAAMTVRNAVQVLEQERLVVARQGRGVFVNAVEPAPAGDPMDTVAQRLDATMKLLQEINERLDRDQAQGAAVDTVPERAAGQGQGAAVDAATERGAGQARGAGVGESVDDILDQVNAKLAAASAALDRRDAAARAAQYEIDHNQAPEQGPDLDIGI